MSNEEVGKRGHKNALQIIYLNFRFCPEQYKVLLSLLYTQEEYLTSPAQNQEGLLPLMHQIGSTGQLEILLSRRILLQAPHTLSDLGHRRLNKKTNYHTAKQKNSLALMLPLTFLSFHLLPATYLFCPISSAYHQRSVI